MTQALQTGVYGGSQQYLPACKFRVSGEISNRLGVGVLGRLCSQIRRYGFRNQFQKGPGVADGFSGSTTTDIVLLGSRRLIADFYVFREDRPIINFHKPSGVLLPV